MRFKRYSIRTEQTDREWIKLYILFTPDKRGTYWPAG
jgi:hypothetical protein